MVRTGASSSNSSRTFGEVIRCQPQMSSCELLFVLRALEVLLSSGVGLEAGVHMMKGGYGAVSEDFSKIMKGVGTGRTLEDELRAAKKRAVSEGYKRLINSLINNVTQNTDLVDTLRVQADRMEEERSEAVAAYIEELGGMPETLLTLGMLGPIVLSLVGLFPQLVGDSPIISMPPPRSSLVSSGWDWSSRQV